ncbi:MAG: OadG-related small transporter subunit [Acidobacteriota bacterium]
MITQQAFDNFWNALIITGQGMTGIFIFMGLFYLAIKLLDKMFPYKAEKNEQEAEMEKVG